MCTNPENLSQEEIKRKIRHLEHSVLLCYIRSGPAFCVNRERRIRVLKSYLEKDNICV